MAKEDIKKIAPTDEPREGEDVYIPTMEELVGGFETQFGLFCKMVDGMSKNSLLRILKKSVGHPFKSDDISLARADEKLPYEMATNLGQIKINMVLEDIRNYHEQEAEKVKEQFGNMPNNVEEPSDGE